MMLSVTAAQTVRDLIGGGENLSVSLKILAVMTALTVLPSIILMTTSFIRIVVVLSFVRRALGTQELPPNQVLVGLSLFLTFMIMTPTWSEIWSSALEPYLNDETAMSERQAVEAAVKPMRRFMFEQINGDDLELFLRLSRHEIPSSGGIRLADVETHVVVSAFLTSELKRAFKMGFMIYLPFVVIDLVVASVLISMGMLVLPPILISLPFKILIFVLVDGWGLVIGKLAESFMGGG